MKYLLLILLTILSVKGLAQETPAFDGHNYNAPYFLDTPKNWGIERFLLPEEFDHAFVAGALEYCNAKKTIADLGQYIRPGGNLTAVLIRDNPLGKFIGQMTGFEPYPLRDVASYFKAGGFSPSLHSLTLPRKKKIAQGFLYAVIGEKC